MSLPSITTPVYLISTNLITSMHSWKNACTSEAVMRLKLTSVNYSEAIAILKRRFGNKQLIIMDVVLNADAVSSQHNLKDLRHLYDSVETQVHGLRVLGVPSDSYGNLLSSVIMSKLPQELPLIVSREITNKELNLDALMRVTERLTLES